MIKRFPQEESLSSVDPPTPASTTTVLGEESTSAPEAPISSTTELAPGATPPTTTPGSFDFSVCSGCDGVRQVLEAPNAELQTHPSLTASCLTWSIKKSAVARSMRLRQSELENGSTLVQVSSRPPSRPYLPARRCVVLCGLDGIQEAVDAIVAAYYQTCA